MPLNIRRSASARLYRNSEWPLASTISTLSQPLELASTFTCSRSPSSAIGVTMNEEKAMSEQDFPKLKRPRHPMPGFVAEALAARGLMDAYHRRPPYQRNDYVGWITGAKRQETVGRRLAQMLDELESGDRYMKMPHGPGSGRRDAGRRQPAARGPQRSGERSRRSAGAPAGKPQEADERVACETPTPGKQSTRIEKWKYDAVRRAILEAVPAAGEGVAFRELPDRVEPLLTDSEKAELGSIGWYTTTVKLDLEVKGEIKRVSGASPQRLVRV